MASRLRSEAIPATVAAYITSAYWFTSSTSFANPAVTLARAMMDTFAGIAPQSVPLFIAGQMLGGAGAALVARWLLGGNLATSTAPHYLNLKLAAAFRIVALGRI